MNLTETNITMNDCTMIFFDESKQNIDKESLLDGKLLRDNFANALSIDLVLQLKNICEEHLNYFNNDQSMIDSFNEIQSRNMQKYIKEKTILGNEEAEREAMLKKQEPIYGYVYLMLNKRNKYYKIGFSKKPKFREKTLQSEEPEIEMIFKSNAIMQSEVFLHEKFANKRLRGEWFKLDESDIKYIKEYLANNIAIKK